MRRRAQAELLRQYQERERWYQRRISELEDKIMYMADRPWTPPPMDLSAPMDHVEEPDFYLPDLEPID